VEEEVSALEAAALASLEAKLMKVENCKI